MRSSSWGATRAMVAVVVLAIITIAAAAAAAAPPPPSPSPTAPKQLSVDLRRLLRSQRHADVLAEDGLWRQAAVAYDQLLPQADRLAATYGAEFPVVVDVAVDMRLTLAKLLRRERMYAEAKRVLHDALAAAPGNVHVANVLASTLQVLGAPGTEAMLEGVLRHVTANTTDTADLYHRLGQLHTASGDAAAALPWLAAAVAVLDEVQEPAWSYVPSEAPSPPMRWAMTLHALGECLLQVNRTADARHVFQRGVDLRLWLDPYQRWISPPQHKFPSSPWWDAPAVAAAPPPRLPGGDDAATGAAAWVDANGDGAVSGVAGPPAARSVAQVVELLEGNFEAIQREALALAPQLPFAGDDEGLSPVGEWSTFRFLANGEWQVQHMADAPVTAAVLSRVADLQWCEQRRCRELFVQLSRLAPGSHIKPHCGPTNTRLRIHLPLVVPAGCSIRVANEARQWTEGKCLVFDDSFEHEVWYTAPPTPPDVDGVSAPPDHRLVLVVDVWHPHAPPEVFESL